MKIRNVCAVVTILSCVVAIMSGCHAAKRDFASAVLGCNSQRRGVITYAVPEGFPMEKRSKFAVAVNGHFTGVYNDDNLWGGSVNFGRFDMSDHGRVNVEVKYDGVIESFEILPQNDIKVRRTSPNTLKFSIDKADTYLTVIINGNFRGDVLHLFADSADGGVPDEARCAAQGVDRNAAGYRYDAERRIHIFGAGYYHLEDMFDRGVLYLRGDEELYVGGGAVIDGQVCMAGGSGGGVYGHGMIMNRVEPNRDSNRIVLAVEGSRDGRIEGVTVFGRRAPGWVCTVSGSANMRYRNVKIISTRYASTDGLDVNHCSDMEFENMFIHSCDDAVAIKGLADARLRPSECPPNSNLKFSRMQLWNDCNNAFGMGAETRASEYENISLTDSDILYSYDDPNHHAALDERAALNICALHGTWFRNITFDNIRVWRCERLAGICFKDSFWFGSIGGDQSSEGGVDGVSFRNIVVMTRSDSQIANKIRLAGWQGEGEQQKLLRNISFDNVVLCGKALQTIEDEAFVIPAPELLENITFRNTDDRR